MKIRLYHQPIGFEGKQSPIPDDFGWLLRGCLVVGSLLLPPVTMYCATGGKTWHSVLTVHIWIIFFFTGSTTFLSVCLFVFLIYQRKTGNCLMALAGKCSNSKIFQSSWVWWKFWKCNHSKKKPEKREVTCQLLWCLRRGEQLVIFKMFESHAVHQNSVSLFPYYQGYICSHKAEGRSTGRSAVTQISQRSAPAVRLVGVQQCRSLSLCLRSHPTLQLHKPLRHCCVKGLQRHDDGKCFIV